MKKLNKFFAVLVALAMMATLCVSMAFAEGETTSATTYDPADAKLVKYLQAGNGVDKPSATFNFVFTAVTDGAPQPAVKTITTAEMTTKDDNGDYIGYKTIADLFAGVKFPSTGVYQYTVTEGAYTEFTPAASPYTDELTIDEGESHTLRLYVKSVNGTNQITGVTVQNGTGKDDPTTVPTIADEGENADHSNKGLSFTNTYKKNYDIADDSETGPLTVKKLVTGDYGDTTYGFPFKVELTLPSANKAGSIKYNINGANVTTETVDADGKATVDITLKANDKLVFVEIPQGTQYKVIEDKSTIGTDLQNADKYVSSFTAGATGTSTTGKVDLEQAEYATLANSDVGVEVTNNLPNDSVTPEGILISNLPYIALALVAVGGLVAYVVVRRKNEDNA